MLIQDVVRIDESGEFRSDVRLTSFYEAEVNRALLRSYLFSSNAPQGQVASLEMLNMVVERFLSSSLENRLLLIANYGHGKSHLALVIANYFARPSDSEEFKTLYEKIRNAARDGATAQRFIEFKNTHPRHLVLILSGDRPVPLRQAFLQAVDKALQHQPETQSIQAPFWFQNAQQWLQEKVLTNTGWREQADAFLGEQYQMDIELLLQRLQERDLKMFEVCRKLGKHLTGVAPDFGAEVALADVIDWLAAELCGEGKPFSGLLILFDEFSLFLDRYYQSSAAGDLQDLLNGVDKHRGRLVFLALAQHDPDSLLTFRTRSRPNDLKVEEVRKELTRIPASARKVLHTLMESVLDSYLDQDEPSWEAVHRQGERAFREATEITYKLFRTRYQQILRWDEAKVGAVLTKGCFPLHPLTTALLCNLPLYSKSGSNPRTVLGFVLQQLRIYAQQPAIRSDSKPNWILPIQLADEFGEMLDDDLGRAYQNTLRNIGTDAPEVWRTVVKAMLLYDAQQLNSSEVSYEQAIAQMTGLEEVQVREALRDLHSKNYIQYDSSRRVYRFWSGTADIQKLEELIQRKQQEFQLEWHNWRDIVEQELGNNLPPIEPDIDWGAPSDWQPRVFLLLPEFCTEANLRSLHNLYRIDHNQGKLVEGDRGLFLLLLARDEDELARYREELPALLEKLYGQDSAIPVLSLALPMEAASVVEHLLRFKALQSFSQSDLERIGDSSIHRSEKSRMQQLIREQLRSIGEFIRQRHPAASYIAPARLRGALQRRATLTAAEAIAAVYEVAYRVRPQFYTQYATRGMRGSNNNLNKAVVQVARLLFKNQADIVQQLSNKLAAELCRKYLFTNWCLLDSSFSICSPEEPGVRIVWEYLDQAIPIGGSVRLTEVLIPLLNPPYGCDPSILLLIASAWIGYHRHDLEFDGGSALLSIEALVQKGFEGANRPSEVLLRLCYRENVGITRRDRAARQKEFEAQVLQAEQANQLSQSEAQGLITRLEQALSDLTVSPSLQERAQKQIRRWSDALNQAREYDRFAENLLQATDLNTLLRSYADLQQLPRYTIVLPEKPEPDEIRNMLRARLEEQTEQHCRRFEQIDAIERAEHHRSQLRLLAERLSKLKLSSRRVDEAKQTLEQSIAQLRQREAESVHRARLEGMTPAAPLHELRRYLQEIESTPDGSEELNTLRAQKREQIRQRIWQLESQIEQWRSEAGNLTNLQSTHQLRDRILQEQRLYEGTPEANEIQILLSQVDQIRTFFDRLSETLRCPLKSQLEQLQLLHAEAQNLHPAQQRVVEEQIERTQRALDEQKQQALHWLEQQRIKAQQPNCDWVNLQRALESPPEFLPSGAQEELVQLRQLAEQRIAENRIEQIKNLFLQLNPKDRSRLLTLLQQLAESA